MARREKWFEEREGERERQTYRQIERSKSRWEIKDQINSTERTIIRRREVWMRKGTHKGFISECYGYAPETCLGEKWNE